MWVAAFLELRYRHAEGLYVDGRLFVVDGDDLKRFVAAYDGNLVVAEVDHAVGVIDDRRRVGGYESLVVANAYHERRAFAGGNYRVGIVGVDYGYRICSDYLIEGLAHRLDQRAVVAGLDVFDELHHHLRIGLADELAAMLHQCLLEHVVVFNRPVVDYRNLSV